MGGNLDIPEAGGWARPPARAVADPAWRRRDRPRFRWAVWLGGLAIASLAGAAVIELLGEARDPGEAPLITPDPTPVRVRPDDPGGMRVANMDKAVYDQLSPAPGQGQAAGARVESLLPPPEAPKPVPIAPPALPAQRAALADAPPEREAPRMPEPAAPSSAAAPAAAPSQAQPLPAVTTPRAPAPVQTASATGRIQVQLAAVPSEAAANAEWERLRRRMPDLLGNQRLTVSRGEREGQPFWRVRTGAFEDAAQARAFCEQVRARGGSCFVAPAG